MTNEKLKDDPTVADYVEVGALAFIVAMIFYPHIFFVAVAVAVVVVYIALNPNAAVEALNVAEELIAASTPWVVRGLVALVVFWVLLTALGYVIINHPQRIGALLNRIDTISNGLDEIKHR